MAKRSTRGAGGTKAATRRSAPAVRPAAPPAEPRSAPGWLDRLSSRLRTPVGFWIAATLVLVLALAARLATWKWIFGSGRVELVPADSHYYVRLARLHLAAGGPVPSDPFVGFPIGSENYWPPLHTLLVTALAAAASDPETGVAYAGPVASLLWFAVLPWVALRTIGARPALVLLFTLALTLIAVESGKVGNADHNVHEPPLAALVLLLATAGVRGSTRAAVAAGVAAGAARLFTTTGFVFPGALAAAWVAAALAAPAAARPELARRAARSGAASVLTLLAGVVALGHPARLDYEAFTLFHPLLACAGFGVAVALAALRGGVRRLAVGGAVAALAILPVAPALLRAAGHLARRDPLLAVVSESRPLAADPLQALLLFGPVLLLLPLALFGAARALRRGGAPELAPATLVTSLFLLGAAAQVRLATFLIGAAAVLLPLGLAAALRAMGGTARGWTAGAAALLMSLLLVAVWPAPPPLAPGQAALIRPTLLWMRDNLPPAADDPWDHRATPRYGVLAPYDYGHFITLYAERPALASTFSQTEAHVEANRIGAELLADTDEERTYRRARELNLAYVLAAPSDLMTGASPDSTALLSRLLRRESFGRFRPLHVSEERRGNGGRFATVFEVVEGAVITARAPAPTVLAAALQDGYERVAAADAGGQVRIRVSRPGLYRVAPAAGGGPAAAPDPPGARFVEITEAQVRAGAEVPVSPAGG